MYNSDSQAFAPNANLNPCRLRVRRLGHTGAKPKSNRRYAVWRDTIVIARCITITVHTARARWIRVMNIHAKRCEQRTSRTASPEHQF